MSCLVPVTFSISLSSFRGWYRVLHIFKKCFVELELKMHCQTWPWSFPLCILLSPSPTSLSKWERKYMSLFMDGAMVTENTVSFTTSLWANKASLPAFAVPQICHWYASVCFYLFSLFSGRFFSLYMAFLLTFFRTVQMSPSLTLLYSRTVHTSVTISLTLFYLSP